MSKQAEAWASETEHPAFSLEKFSKAGKAVLIGAHEEAYTLRHESIGTEHLFLGLLRNTGSLAATALIRLGMTRTLTRRAVGRITGDGKGSVTQQLHLRSDAIAVLLLSVNEAEWLQQTSVQPEHILLALLRKRDDTLVNILMLFGTDPEKVRARLFLDIGLAGMKTSTKSTPAKKLAVTSPYEVIEENKHTLPDVSTPALAPPTQQVVPPPKNEGSTEIAPTLISSFSPQPLPAPRMSGASRPLSAAVLAAIANVPTRPLQRLSQTQDKPVSRRHTLKWLGGITALAATSTGVGIIVSSRKMVNASTSTRALATATAKTSATPEALLRYTYPNHYAPVHSLVWEPRVQTGQDQLRIASSAKNMHLWNALDGSDERICQDAQSEMLALAWCHSSTKIASGDQAGTLQIWLATSTQATKQLTGHKGAINAVSWAMDGVHIATGSNDMQVGLWPLHAPEDTSTPLFLRNHRAIVYTVSFSHESLYLASGSADKTVMLWRVQDGRYLYTYTGHSSGVRAVACAPQTLSTGILLASGSDDTTVHIWRWDAQTNQMLPITRYTGHRGPVYCLAWSPDGSKLASGDALGMFHLWNSQTGEPLLVTQAHHGAIHSLAWSPDGKYLASAGQDGIVHVYQVPF